MPKKQTIEQIETAIARWQTRLRRAVRMVEKLERQQKRLAKRQASQPDPAIAPPLAKAVQPKPAPVTPPASNGTEKINTPEIDTEIPAFLRRQKPGNPIGEQIKAEIEATKTAKARGRIATMKAKKSGETKKMPLTGKAALAAIRG